MSAGPDIRFITRKWPPAVGGMETYCVRLTEELARRSSVDVVALPGRPCGRAPGVAAILAFGARAVARLMSSPEARVVHVGDLASWPLAWVASARHSRSRIIISAHGSDVSVAQRRGWRAWVYRKYLQLGGAALRKARVIANSTYVASLAQRAGFNDVRIVPLGTDLGAAPATDRQHLLYAGRISRAKGLRFIVEDVLPLLPESTRLRVAGTLWEARERPLLSHSAVDYLGVLSPDDLAAEYARSAAVLVPTRESEGFGLAAIEAAACGGFVIASDHSGLADLVLPPIGLAVNANDPREWASAIRRALAMSEEERAQQAGAARALVDRKYRWAHVAEATRAAYDAA